MLLFSFLLLGAKAALPTDPANVYYCPPNSCLDEKQSFMVGPQASFRQCVDLTSGAKTPVATFNYDVAGKGSVDMFFDEMAKGTKDLFPMEKGGKKLATVCCNGFQDQMENNFEWMTFNQCKTWKTKKEYRPFCAKIKERDACSENCFYAFSDNELSPLIPDGLIQSICMEPEGKYTSICPTECTSEPECEIVCDQPVCEDGSFPEPIPGTCCGFEPCPEPCEIVCDQPICEDGSFPEPIPGTCCGFEPCPDDLSSLGKCKNKGKKTCDKLYKKKFGKKPHPCETLFCDDGECSSAMIMCAADIRICESGEPAESDPSTCCGSFPCPEDCPTLEQKECKKAPACQKKGNGCIAKKKKSKGKCKNKDPTACDEASDKCEPKTKGGVFTCKNKKKK